MPVNLEQLDQWVEHGYHKDAIALYGTSAEFLTKALQTGQVPYNAPAAEDMLPYQKEVMENGGHLYYALPIYERLEENSNPRAKVLLEGIIEKYGDFPEEIKEELSWRRQHKSSKDYALKHAIEHPFNEKFKVRLHARQIYILASILFPSDSALWDEDESLLAITGPDYHPLDFSHQRAFENSERAVKDLQQVISECFKRRGVVIYYSSKILDHAKPGYEAEREIMIVSKKPLPIDVISGVEILSEADRKSLYQ